MNILRPCGGWAQIAPCDPGVVGGDPSQPGRFNIHPRTGGRRGGGLPWLDGVVSQRNRRVATETSARNTPGPCRNTIDPSGHGSDNVPFTFDAAGTFEVSRAIVTLDGNVSLGCGNASGAGFRAGGPPTLPVLEPANECTVADTTTGTTIFRDPRVYRDFLSVHSSPNGPCHPICQCRRLPGKHNVKNLLGEALEMPATVGRLITRNSMLPAVQETLYSFPGQIQ